MSSSPAAYPPLSLPVKIIYGIGQISNSVKTFAFGAFLLFFYTSVMGLPGTLAGLATTISLFWDALIDPSIGHLSDKAKFSLGRRHSFMLVGAVGMGLSFFAIFNPPDGLGNLGLFFWLIGSNFFLRTSNSLFIVPYQALGAELAQDYQERTSIAGVRSFLALLGTGIAFSTLSIFFPNDGSGVDPKFNRDGYLTMAISFGVFMAITGLVATFGTLRQRYRLPVRQRRAQEEELSFIENLKISIRHRSFLLLTLSAALYFLASAVTTTVVVHFLTYYMAIGESSAISLFQAAFFVGGILGVLSWLRLSPRLEKHRLYFITTLTTSILTGSAFFLMGEGHLFGTGNIRPLLGLYLLVGFFAGAFWFLPASMIADIVDEDKLQTGKNREGAYFGIDSFFQQQASGLAVLVSGVLLDVFAGLVPGQSIQTAETATRIGVIFSLVPALLYAAAAFLILPYQLTRQRVRLIQQKLTQAKEDTYESEIYA